EEQALVRCGIDDRAAGKLAEDSRNPADREQQADHALRPAVGDQIDGDERTESGLDIGDEEVEPIERALTLIRWCGIVLCQRRCSSRGVSSLGNADEVARAQSARGQSSRRVSLVVAV